MKYYSSKKDSLEAKKQGKIEESIEKSINLIKNNQFVQATEQLEALIIQNDLPKNQKFNGVGNEENWRFGYRNGLFEWFQKELQNREIGKNPFDLLNICFIMQLHSKNSTIKRILKKYQKLLQKTQSRYQLELGLGNVYYSDMQYLEAEKIYGNIVRDHPNCQKAWEYLAWTQYQFQRDEKVFKNSSKCLNINLHNKSARFLKAVSLGNQEEIRKQLQILALKYPKCCRICIAIGDFAKTNEESLNKYMEAINLQPNSAFIRAKIAEIYLQEAECKPDIAVEKIQQARKWIEVALTLQPTCPEAYIIMGAVQAEQKRYQQAFSTIKKGILQFPNNFALFEELALLYNEFEYINDTIECYQKYIQLNPYNASVHNNIAATYFKLRKDEKCIYHYKKALEINPKCDKIYGNLGLAYQTQYSNSEAIAAYKKAYQLNERECKYMKGLSINFLTIRKYEEAKQWAFKILELTEKDQDKSASYCLLRKIQFFQENYFTGLQWYLKQTSLLKSLDVKDITKFLMKILSMQKIKALILSLFDSVDKKKENLYEILQLAEILRKLNLMQESRPLYCMAQKLHQQSFVSKQISRLLKKVSKLK